MKVSGRTARCPRLLTRESGGWTTVPSGGLASFVRDGGVLTLCLCSCCC